MLKGNRGEWSEVYVLLRLLADGRVYAADGNLNRISPDRYLTIDRIVREEVKGRPLSYRCGETVRVEDGAGGLCTSVPRSEFARQADLLCERLLAPSREPSFPLPETEEFMRRILVGRLKAPSRDKADLVMQVRDPFTGSDPLRGWSIKSELGNPPTLLNAGRTTNFHFSVGGLSPADCRQANGIGGRSKVRDRIAYIESMGGRLRFEGLESAVFQRNMQLVDTCFPQIAAEALLRYYRGQGRTCAGIVSSLERDDPLRLGPGMYEFKFKKFLAAVALGMMPSVPWSGYEDASGGYLVVCELDGRAEVLAFDLGNRNEFEDYLLGSTRFETASTSRHGFGSVVEGAGQTHLALNLQIRFIR